MRRLKKARKSLKRVEWEDAEDIKVRFEKLVKSVGVSWVDPQRIFFYRSHGSKSRAYARTWGLPKLWQSALGVAPAYIIEVISHYFDDLPESKQDEILLHEVSHVPKNFSGALLPHIRRGKRSFHRKVETLVDRYYALKGKSKWKGFFK